MSRPVGRTAVGYACRTARRSTREGGRDRRHPERGQGQRVPRGRDARGRPRAGRTRATASWSRTARARVGAPRGATSRAPGAESCPTPTRSSRAADMIVKVKEPQPAGVRAGSARARSCSPTCTWRPTRAHRVPRATAGRGRRLRDRPARPTAGSRCSRPMSEIAGRMAPHVGARPPRDGRTGGRGVLMGGVSGVAPGPVVVLGAGMAGHERRLDRGRHGGRGHGRRQERRPAPRTSTRSSRAGSRR